MFRKTALMGRWVSTTVAVARGYSHSFTPESHVINKLESDLAGKGYYYRKSDIKVQRVPTANPLIDHVYATVLCGIPKRSILSIAGRID